MLDPGRLENVFYYFMLVDDQRERGLYGSVEFAYFLNIFSIAFPLANSSINLSK